MRPSMQNGEGGRMSKTSQMSQISEKLPKCFVSISCACCNCCGACLLFCVTATFWAYHDKHGVGTITQKSVFLGFSIAYVIIAICVGASLYAALMLLGSRRKLVDKLIDGIQPRMALPSTQKSIQAIQGTIQNADKKLRNFAGSALIEKQEVQAGEGGGEEEGEKSLELDISWVKRSASSAWKGANSALAYHITIFAVLVVCCVVSFSLCWAFVTNWDGNKDNKASLFAAGVIATLATTGLCFAAMGLAIRDTVKDIQTLQKLISEKNQDLRKKVTALTSSSSARKGQWDI